MATANGMPRPNPAITEEDGVVATTGIVCITVAAVAGVFIFGAADVLGEITCRDGGAPLVGFESNWPGGIKPVGSGAMSGWGIISLLTGGGATGMDGGGTGAACLGKSSILIGAPAVPMGVSGDLSTAAAGMAGGTGARSKALTAGAGGCACTTGCGAGLNSKPACARHVVSIHVPVIIAATKSGPDAFAIVFHPEKRRLSGSGKKCRQKLKGTLPKTSDHKMHIAK